MKHYELVYIAQGAHAENEVEKITTLVDDLIKKQSGEITFTSVWGRKKLAYPIKHNNHGWYIHAEFDMAPEGAPLLERDLRLENEVLRHMLLQKDEKGAPLTPESTFKKNPSDSLPPIDLSPDTEKKAETPTEIKKEEDKKEEDKTNLKELDKKLDEILKSDIV